MQAVILAGGLGTRLLPLTLAVPKPMAPVAGRPYLEYQVELLREQDIRDVVLLTGYLGEQIEDWFGDGSRHGVSIRYSREPEPLGTGGALKLALPLLDRAFILLNGDSYLPVAYFPLIHELDRAEAALAVYDNRLSDTGVPNNIALDGAGMVARYAKGVADPELTHVDAGALAVRRATLERIPARVFSFENELYPVLISERGLAAWPAPHRFYDMGTPRGLSMLEEYLKR